MAARSQTCSTGAAAGISGPGDQTGKDLPGGPRSRSVSCLLQGISGLRSDALQERGVQLLLGVGVSEVGPGHVSLSDGRKILTHTTVWAGGSRLQAYLTMWDCRAEGAVALRSSRISACRFCWCLRPGRFREYSRFRRSGIAAARLGRAAMREMVRGEYIGRDRGAAA